MDEIRVVSMSSIRHSQVDQPGFSYIGCNESARCLYGRQNQRQVTSCGGPKANLVAEDVSVHSSPKSVRVNASIEL